MNKNLLCLLLVLLLSLELISITHAQATPKPRAPRVVKIQVDKGSWFEVMAQTTNKVYSTPAVYFQDLPADGAKFMEGLKAAMVALTACTPTDCPNAVNAINTMMATFIDKSSSTQFIDSWFMNDLRGAVGKTLESNDAAQVKIRFRGTSSLLANLAKSVESQLKLNTETTRKTVRTAFRALESNLRMIIDTNFDPNPKHLAELPQYTMAATFYFMIQSQFQRFATQWGFDSTVIDAQSRNLKTCLVKYSNHARDTFELAVSKIALEPEEGPMAGQNKFDRVIQLRRTIIPAVFDFVAMWSRMDGSVFPSGSYAEPIRKLYSPTAGFLVDWQAVDKVHSKQYEPDYITYQRTEEMFQHANHEQYLGQLIQVKFIQNYYYLHSIGPKSMQRNKIDTIETGGSRGNSPQGKAIGGLPAGIITFKLSPTLNDQNISLVSEAFPLMIASTNPGPKKIDLHFHGIPKRRPGCWLHVELLEQYEYCVFPEDWEVPYKDNTDFSVTGHKITDIFAWYMTIRSEEIGTADVIQAAFIPKEVFPENALLPKVTTMINAQKYVTSNGNVGLVRDDFMIGSHSMKMPAGSALMFYFEASGADRSFNIGLFAKAPVNPASVSIFRQVGSASRTLITTISIPMSDDYKSYIDISTVVPIKKDPYTTRESFTIETNTVIYLNSVIFSPLPVV
ncbi:hypothetical protein SAMD00019534_008590 [Acytostelium subglobosum LB1]|uniref:hypothetical protein n=1 Tax=Acytostelium subglobosum LB1 TaxID=1410327 RepID=UPI0006451B25|nr:hypothetical protein SAMD00019534_008590 [Acytostelium subglobosum LB1]GAM17684.1 hypothetical protein SAMD00019534_008590 [Acytostelium subglobosum LB1]|eukprot:XP_012758280.1 hypothetical protein SAMD00019534_008590 [Acytostelium subglobosum LB1]